MSGLGVTMQIVIDGNLEGPIVEATYNRRPIVKHPHRLTILTTERHRGSSHNDQGVKAVNIGV